MKIQHQTIDAELDTDLLGLFESRLKRAQHLFDGKLEFLQGNPVQGLETIIDVFQSALALEFIPRYAEWAEARGGTREQCVAQLRKEAEHLGRYPSYSTSPGHNLMAVEKASFFLKLVDDIETLKNGRAG